MTRLQNFVVGICKVVITGIVIAIYYGFLRLFLWLMPEFKWASYLICLSGTASALSILLFNQSLLTGKKVAGTKP